MLVLGGSNIEQLKQAKEYYESLGPVLVVCISQLAPLHRLLCGGLHRLSEEVKRFRPDIIHSIFIQSDIIGSWIRKSCHIPIHISSLEGALVPDNSISVKRSLYKFAYILFAKHSLDSVIALCHATADDVVHSYSLRSEILHIIPSGVDLKEFTPKLGWPYSLAQPPTTIGMIARLVPEKLPHLLIHAAPNVLQNFPSARFVIAGCGPELPHLEVLARNLGVAESFSFPGWVDDPGSLLQQIDILVFLSTQEGLPWTILEAQSVGVPVIASAVGGVPEIIFHKKNGLLQNSYDPLILSRQIVWLMEHRQDAARMAQAGQIGIQTNFSIEQEVKLLMDLYDRFLTSQPS
jgi:glycosyltransferase involved in cell wall biosynthesis